MSLATTAAVVAALWPGHLAVGVSRPPGEVPALDARHQYLAGGVNTGTGWSTWNDNGTFVSRYVKESHARGVVPVLTYYMLLQSRSSLQGGEAEKDLAHLRDRALMRAYWRDYTLALKRARARKLVILHIEPDLFGYMHQAAKRDRAAAAHRRFARRLVRLRDRHARNVRLAYHLSTWGTGEDPTYSDPPMQHMDRLTARSARFYRSLRARFDYAFNDVADRDAGFRRHVLGDGGGADGTTSPETDVGLFFRLAGEYLKNPLKLR